MVLVRALCGLMSFFSEILGLIGFKLEDTGGQTNKQANKVGTWIHFISFHFISFYFNPFHSFIHSFIH